jgi:O-acetyl-ADP-ribose deacetylase (regulator of RNase III)
MVESRLSVIEGDITRQLVDAVVNAANPDLRPGGGVAGAIHRAAGPELWEECRGLGGCATGEAKITKGYGLPAAWVIHTVGPVWQGGEKGEDSSLASCYRSVLEIARARGLGSVAFPAISTGAYGFPPERAVRIAVRETAAFLSKNPVPERVVFVCFGAGMAVQYRAALAELP